MRHLLPLVILLTGCATRPVPADAVIVRENARLIEERNGLIEHMDLLQSELFRLRLREEYLTEELMKVNARRTF